MLPIYELGKCPCYLLPIPFALLIGRRLRLGTGQHVQDAQPRQRQEIIEGIHYPPEEPAQRPSDIAILPAGLFAPVLNEGAESHFGQPACNLSGMPGATA